MLWDIFRALFKIQILPTISLKKILLNIIYKW